VVESVEGEVKEEGRRDDLRRSLWGRNLKGGKPEKERSYNLNVLSER